MIKRVGVIGGGQLAWMMAGAAEKLGVELIVQTPSQTDSAVAIAADTIFAAIDDATATAQLAAQCDVITFENEFVDLEALSLLVDQGVCFRPSLNSLAPLLDKYYQRCLLQEVGLPVPQFAALGERHPKSKVKSQKPEDCHQRDFAEEISSLHRYFPLSSLSSFPVFLPSFPVVLKTRRHGYDGQGTFILKNLEALQATLMQLQHVPVLLEEFVPFERELAAIAARSATGEISVYPIVETQQENQVCRRVFAPVDLEPSVTAQVEAIAQTLLDHLQIVGVLGIELFLTSEGKVLVNEVAPRVHNSGHFTLDACETSQFEQHLRAVCGLPLGNPAMLAPAAVMVNLLGFEHAHSDYLELRQQLAAIPNAHVHWYGKTESRLGRKLGHVTVLLQDKTQAGAIAQQIEDIWYATSEA